MDQDRIERAAVRAVEEYIDINFPKMAPDIHKNDKTPIWDGDIFLYDSEESKTVNNFVARVPLQVKGTTSTIDCYYIKPEFIKGFKSDRGCVFFLVQVSENPPKVLYAILTSEVLDSMLKRTSKTIRIDLQEVPSNPRDFEKKLYAFAAKRNSEKVENTSPNEIKKLVEGFEEIRGHLKEIEDKSIQAKLKTHLDSIKNLSEDTQDDDTIGWRDSFYFCSREAIDLAIDNIENYDFVNLQFDLGYYLVNQKQYHLAENYYLNVLTEYLKRSDIVNVATTLNNLAVLHDILTRYDEAENEYKDALKIRRELAKTNRDAYNADVAMTLNNLANLHYNLTRYDEAEKEYKEALMIYRELAKTNRDAHIADMSTTLNNLGNLYRAIIRYNEAEKEYKEALEIRRELAMTNRDAYIEYVAQTLNNLAILHKNLTRYDEAEKEYKEALAIDRELAKKNSDAHIADVATDLNNLAALHYNLTRYDEAEKEYKEALEIRRELAKTNRDAYIEYVAMTLYNIALLQIATDCKAEAKKTAEEALGIFEELAKAYPQIWNSKVEKTEQLLKDLSKKFMTIHDNSCSKTIL